MKKKKKKDKEYEGKKVHKSRRYMQKRGKELLSVFTQNKSNKTS